MMCWIRGRATFNYWIALIQTGLKSGTIRRTSSSRHRPTFRWSNSSNIHSEWASGDTFFYLRSSLCEIESRIDEHKLHCRVTFHVGFLRRFAHVLQNSDDATSAHAASIGRSAILLVEISTVNSKRAQA
jgi:hypothetical protein